MMRAEFACAAASLLLVHAATSAQAVPEPAANAEPDQQSAETNLPNEDDTVGEVPVAADTSTVIEVPTGTQILMRTTQDISSETVRKGDLFQLEVAQDYELDGSTVITAGTQAVAEFTQVERKGMLGRGGKLAARALYLNMPQGPVRLSGEVGSSGSSQTGLATVVTGLIGVGIFIEGKAAIIPAGTDLEVVLDRAARVPVSGG